MTTAFNYQQAFSRNIGWFTVEEQQKLQQSRIAIAGCGGVGGCGRRRVEGWADAGQVDPDLARSRVWSRRRSSGPRCRRSTSGSTNASVACRLSIQSATNLNDKPRCEGVLANTSGYN